MIIQVTNQTIRISFKIYKTIINLWGSLKTKVSKPPQIKSICSQIIQKSFNNKSLINHKIHITTIKCKSKLIFNHLTRGTKL